MIPLDQTINGNGENGEPVGNCWQACVASLLDLQLDQVPHFAMESPHSWFRSTRRFVFQHTGFDLGCFVPKFPLTEPGQYVIGVGPSPRGDFLHAVILDGTTGELAHDPHLSRAGLAGPVAEVFGFIEAAS
jgi:hypothetical protein